jgi:hypothetical protein
MPIAQLLFLGLIISAFGVFMIVLLSVSLYVSAGKKEEPASTVVTLARRASQTETAKLHASQATGAVRRFG